MISDKDIQTLKTQFDYLEKRFSESQHIVVYRHRSPDYDALGAQMGLVTWIKDNFPDKDVHFVGDAAENLIPSLFPQPEVLDEAWYNQEHLAITVDVSDSKRIADNHILKAKEVIKIDHHPLPEEEYAFGNYLIVYPDRPAASELIALFATSRGGLFKKKRILSKQMATYCYIGIVGDTNRFEYEDTDSATLRVAADLLDLGADKEAIYAQMYRMDERRINIIAYCLSNYKITEKGTCYVVLDKETMTRLNMTINEANMALKYLRPMKEVRLVCSIAWDEGHGEWRISLRSQSLVVSPAAMKFNGGGHDYAAGATLKSLDQLPDFLAACDAL